MNKGRYLKTGLTIIAVAVALVSLMYVLIFVLPSSRAYERYTQNQINKACHDKTKQEAVTGEPGDVIVLEEGWTEVVLPSGWYYSEEYKPATLQGWGSYTGCHLLQVLTLDGEEMRWSGLSSSRDFNNPIVYSRETKGYKIYVDNSQFEETKYIRLLITDGERWTSYIQKSNPNDQHVRQFIEFANSINKIK